MYQVSVGAYRYEYMKSWLYILVGSYQIHVKFVQQMPCHQNGLT